MISSLLKSRLPSNNFLFLWCRFPHSESSTQSPQK